VPKHTAQWNPQTQLWETDQADLFSEQQEPFSETWPTSGMTRNGQLLPLPASEHPTGESESSLSLMPTPTKGDGEGGGKRHGVTWEDTTKSTGAGGASRLRDVVGLLPTPRATDGTKGGPNQRGSSGDLMLPSAVLNL
jgi:hypothetical protein